MDIANALLEALPPVCVKYTAKPSVIFVTI